MEAREFAIVQALARHALYAAAELPPNHPQRSIVRHQVSRLQAELAATGDQESQRRSIKIADLGQWFDAGAVKSTEKVVLSGAAP